MCVLVSFLWSSTHFAAVRANGPSVLFWKSEAAPTSSQNIWSTIINICTVRAVCEYDCSLCFPAQVLQQHPVFLQQNAVVCVCFFFFSSYCSSGRVPTPAALILQWRGLERRALSPAARPHYLSLGAPHPVLRLTPHSTCLIMEPWTSLVFVILWLTGYSRRLLNQRQGGLTLLTQLIFEYCNVPV